MRPDDVRALLEQASTGLPRPDLADRVWADAILARRRTRRRIGMLAGFAALALVAVAALAGPAAIRTGDEVVPSPPPTLTVPQAGTIDGTPYWVGPAAGSEAWLDRLPTVLGDRVGPPDGRIEDLGSRPIRRIAAVSMLALPQQGRYRPVLVGVSGGWADSGVEVAVGRDAGGRTVPALDTTSVSPSGSSVAFAQPNHVVVVDGSTGQVRDIPVPSATIRHVAWLPSGDRLLASGPGGTYRVLVGAVAPGARAVERLGSGSDPTSVTPPFALDSDASGELLVRYDADGARHVAGRRPVLPVSRWQGATFTAGTLAARSLLPAPLPELEATDALTPGTQLLAVVEAAGSTATPGKLLVLPDSKGSDRAPGCCQVLGWYDEHTVLFESRTSGDDWILAWDVHSGQVLRVAELDAAQVALGPILVR